MKISISLLTLALTSASIFASSEPDRYPSGSSTAASHGGGVSAVVPTAPVEHAAPTPMPASSAPETVSFRKDWFLECLGSRGMNYARVKEVADTNPDSLLSAFEQELEGLLYKKDSEIRKLQTEVEALNKQVADLKASAASHAAPMPAVPPCVF